MPNITIGETLGHDTGATRSPVYSKDAYTTGIPAPPRIYLAAPVLGESAIEELQRQRPSFLNHSIPYQPGKIAFTALSWKYEDRRQAQRILPYLYLGPSPKDTTAEWMRIEGITFAIGIANSMPRIIEKGLERAAALGLKTEYIDIPHNHNLVSAFPSISALIGDHVNTLMTFDQVPKVFVFCESGNERSAAAVMAFLIEAYEGLHFTVAVRAVQTLRFSVVADEATKQSLSSYFDIVSARRSVAAISLAAPSDGSKRRRAERDGEDVGTYGPQERPRAPFEERMNLD